MTAEALHREYSAREFNRDPSAVSRAAHKFGTVRITHRGQPSLIVVDAAQYPDLMPPVAPTILGSLSVDWKWDDAALSEPPRAQLNLQVGDLA